MEDLSFEEFAEFIRECGQLGHEERITPDTQFERDLGITGDDGDDLLRASEKRFGVKFTRETFNLKPNEFLFGPEASFGDLITLFRHWKSQFRSFTLGELFEAIRRELKSKS
jgi:acyl carrier protein